jgi:hypothetical protein
MNVRVDTLGLIICTYAFFGGLLAIGANAHLLCRRVGPVWARLASLSIGAAIVWFLVPVFRV